MSKDKNILALDLGTHCGWAYSARGIIFSGVWSLKPQRYEGGGMRYVRFVKYLEELNASCPMHEIYYEEVRRHKATDAAHVYGGLMAHLTSWCEAKNIPYAGVPVGEIKKSWTGNGAARKETMIAEARARGFETFDDNEADALALLHLKAGL